MFLPRQGIRSDGRPLVRPLFRVRNGACRVRNVRRPASNLTPSPVELPTLAFIPTSENLISQRRGTAVAVGECVEAVVARAHASMHPEDGLSVCDEPQDAERDRAQSDSEDLLPAVHQGCPARVSERACDRVTGATGRTPTTSAGAYCAGLSTVLPGEEYLRFWYPLINISSRCSLPNRSDD